MKLIFFLLAVVLFSSLSLLSNSFILKFPFFIILLYFPGKLILSILNIKILSRGEKFLYTIFISLSVLMFGSFLINNISLLLGFTSPLRPLSLTIGFDLILFLLSAISYSQKKTIIQLNSIYYRPKLYYLGWLILPIIGILGVFRLSNTNENTLSLITYSIIGLAIFLSFIFRNKVTTFFWLIAIYSIAISVLLSGWLRSNYISGVDINQEFQIANIIHNAGYWDLSLYRNAYTACLSIGILPEVLSIFTGISLTHVFKIIFPVLFSFVPIIVYFISYRIIKDKHLSFLSAIFFLSQPGFTTWMWIPIRQEMAFIFLSLSILISLDKQIFVKKKKILFLIFSTSMVVSHYSTSYIAIGLFLISNILFYITKIGKMLKISKYEVSYIFPSLTQTFLLFFITYLWFAQLTTGFNGFSEFIKQSISNTNRIFSEETQASGQSFFDQFKFTRNNVNQLKNLNEYSTLLEQKAETININDRLVLSNKYKPSLVSSDTNDYKYDERVSYYGLLIREILKNIGKIAIGLGALYFLFKFQNGKNNGLIFLSSFILMIVILLIPYISISYDLVRTYQQILITSSLFVFVIFTNKKLKKVIFSIISCTFVSLYFLFLTNTLQQYLGGGIPAFQFNNKGTEYQLYYTHDSEVIAGNWFSTIKLNGDIHADTFEVNRLRLSTFSNKINMIKSDVLPLALTKKSYVILSNTNTINRIGMKPYKGGTIFFSFPYDFLEEEKNLIYNNRGSKIFR